jgi:hypothetical protein
MVTITLVLGALVFCTALYRLKLISTLHSDPRLVGALAVLVNALLERFSFSPGNLGIVALLNEVFPGVWLIVKGFNPSAIAARAAESDVGQPKIDTFEHARRRI